MGKDVFIMLLGVWVAILPFLGFPGSWDRILLLISGIIIISIGISLRREQSRKDTVSVNKPSEAQHVEENN
jgi:uncharacterized membrane protein